MSMTLKEMRDQVIADLDLEDEDFIDSAGIDKLINLGRRYAERHVHNLYEDYFLDEAIIPITQGSSLISYPVDIYASKVRSIFFADGVGNSTSSHRVHREKDLTKAMTRDFYGSDSTNPLLTWHPVNQAVGGRKIRLFPISGRTGNLHVWYIRNSLTLVNDADICDIDEFGDYIIQVAKRQIYLNDGDPRADDAKILEEELEIELISTLSDMSPDGDNTIDPDMSHYDDSSIDTGDC